MVGQYKFLKFQFSLKSLNLITSHKYLSLVRLDVTGSLFFLEKAPAKSPNLKDSRLSVISRWKWWFMKNLSRQACTPEAAPKLFSKNQCDWINNAGALCVLPISSHRIPKRRPQGSRSNEVETPCHSFHKRIRRWRCLYCVCRWATAPTRAWGAVASDTLVWGKCQTTERSVS